MYAVKNYPGSTHFCYFKGTKAECLTWAKNEAYLDPFNGPIRILSNKEVESWKWNSGRRVVTIEGMFS